MNINFNNSIKIKYLKKIILHLPYKLLKILHNLCYIYTLNLLNAQFPKHLQLQVCIWIVDYIIAIYELPS